MSELIYVVVVFSLLTIADNVRSQTDPLFRETANGFVKGAMKYTSMGQKYYSFRSVPYAEPPVTGQDPYTKQTVDRRFKVCSTTI